MIRIITSAALLRPRAGLAHAPINGTQKQGAIKTEANSKARKRGAWKPLPRTFQYVLREIRTHVTKHYKNAELVVFRHVAAKQDQEG